MAFSVNAQPAGFGGEQRVELDAAWRDTALVPGEKGALAVLMQIAPGWHVNPGLETNRSSEFQIPSRIVVNAPDGWTVGTPNWDEPHELDLPALGGVVPIYEGQVVATLAVEAPDDTEAGSHDLEVILHYQACDDSICEPPTSTTRTIRVEVADSAEVIEANAAYFPAMDDADTPDDGVEQHATAKLVVQRPVAFANDVIGVAVVIDIDPHWHIYPAEGTEWEPDDFIPTSIELDLPPGWRAGEVEWPEPELITMGVDVAAEELLAYENQVVALVPIALPDADRLPTGPYDLRVKVHYMACADVCLPPTWTRARATLEVAEPGAEVPPVAAQDAAYFDGFVPRFDDALPGDTGIDDTSALEMESSSTLSWDEGRWWLALAFVWLAMGWMIVQTFRITQRVSWRAVVSLVGIVTMLGWLGFTRVITAESEGWLPYSHETAAQARAEGKTVIVDFTASWCINCKVVEKTVLNSAEVREILEDPRYVALIADVTNGTGEGQERLAELGGGGIPLLTIEHPNDAEPISFRGLYTQAPVVAALRGETAEVGEGFVFDFFGARFTVGEGSWAIVLLIAAVAGFFLNFTPCVLPVIPIKILSLQAHAKDPSRCFLLGLVFGLGIVAMFAVLGVLIAGLAFGLDRADWGDFFKYWWVSLAMGLLVGAMGVAMLGVFSVQLPGFVYMFNPQSDSVQGSFLMGVFAAVLSTPCTGPLLGATLVWVAAQPAWLGFTTLVVMGVGMALPYILLTANPKWLDRMPRTGPGSELVKQVMGLLLLAVAAFFIGTAFTSLGVPGESAAEASSETAEVQADA